MPSCPVNPLAPQRPPGQPLHSCPCGPHSWPPATHKYTVTHTYTCFDERHRDTVLPQTWKIRQISTKCYPIALYIRVITTISTPNTWVFTLKGRSWYILISITMLTGTLVFHYYSECENIPNTIQVLLNVYSVLGLIPNLPITQMGYVDIIQV